MIKRLMIEDGVSAVVMFRDDGRFLEGYGGISENMMRQLAEFAHNYKRLSQANADQLSMFTRISAWTPPKGWVVHGDQASVCNVGNIACLVDNNEANISEIISAMTEIANY